MTSIPTTADLLRLLREDPDFRDEVRRLVLSQDLLELPERFARFEGYVERQFAEMRGDMTEMRGDIARLDEGQAQMRQDITRLDEGQAQMRQDIAEMRENIAKNTSDIGSLRGWEYERRVARNFASHASMAIRQRNGRGLRRTRMLSSNTFGVDPAYLDLIADALDAGLIANEEWADLQQADAVMSGQHEGSTIYFVGEFSVTVNNHDIERAIARADILARATGCDAWPMVVGDNIPEPQMTRMEAERVVWRRVAEAWGLVAE